MTPETESVLCIGGSKDGQTVEVEKGSQFFVVPLCPKPDEMLAGRDIQVEEYHRIHSRHDGGDLPVFAPEALKLGAELLNQGAKVTVTSPPRP